MINQKEVFNERLEQVIKRVVLLKRGVKQTLNKVWAG